MLETELEIVFLKSLLADKFRVLSVSLWAGGGHSRQLDQLLQHHNAMDGNINVINMMIYKLQDIQVFIDQKCTIEWSA